MDSKRGKVWLGICAFIIDAAGRLLVVKKRYGGLKGQWSLPAGFVEPGETVDEAVKREVMEETGIACEVNGLIGVRTGVIRNDISDNMLIFTCKPLMEKIKVQKEELFDVQWLSVKALLKDKDTSLLIRQLIELNDTEVKAEMNDLHPGDQFGYTSYKVFL